MPPPSKKPRKDLKIEVKLQLIEDRERDPKLSFRKLGEKYDCGKTSAERIWNARDAIRKANETNQNLSGCHVSHVFST